MSIRFKSISIHGYRGRYFTLDIPEEENNTVFQMDGNTGKTTTIELLRWCFRYKESEAACKYQHMWLSTAHVLDWNIEGKQECSILIIFEDKDGTEYKFERVTKGSHRKSKRREECRGDVIKTISDSLEIGRGEKVLTGDGVNNYLNSEFHLGASAEYLCFDGEKAREMMIMATRVNELIEHLKRRTTHRQVEYYLDCLDNFEDLIVSEIGRVDSEKSRQLTHGKLRTKTTQISDQERLITSLEDAFAVYTQKAAEYGASGDRITKEIVDQEKSVATKKLQLENRRKEITKEIASIRKEIYERCHEWMFLHEIDMVNSAKDAIREHGRLPEPYHEDLITGCLNSSPPTCLICGRELNDKTSKEHVKKLGQQIASHQVQEFLTAALSAGTTEYPVKEKRERVRQLVDELDRTISEIDALKLSAVDKELLRQRNETRNLFGDFHRKIGETQDRLATEKALLEMYKEEAKRIREKSDGYKKNKPLYDEIEKLRSILEETRNRMRKSTIEVISVVISKAVSNILGPRFSAMLDENEGLQLGEDGVYGQEVGGYSGRLILSYLFAEAMSQVEPIIIDTPTGNIGTHRPALAKHLASNHSQVILLCLPTELSEFAEHLTDKIHIIENETPS